MVGGGENLWGADRVAGALAAIHKPSGSAKTDSFINFIRFHMAAALGFISGADRAANGGCRSAP